MKYLVYILLVLASALAVYNATLLNFTNLLEGNSRIAVYSILGCASAIVLLITLLISYKIKEKAQG
ncbi:hypothetical protein NBT05_06920 [Aquimarina sp. ERC-38]|uniref:hypothetical protein n=1 Tax=Aquimarina sp. ERC-38 TaxID=2949996 RepID=UPI0022458F0E|nr:hypothetical protein [Aquimarina sp. ERC-38]UZO82200.1 hypothetical protein NBT05_06920 [Aquimarina sp. ERC-38]